MSSQKTLIVINSSGNDALCKKMNNNLSDLQNRLSAIGYNFQSYQVSSLVSCFNYKGGSYPIIMGNIFWLPFVVQTDSSVWQDIQNGIDRRNELNVLNGKFDGRVFIKMQLYSGPDEIQNNYIDPSDNDKLMTWVSTFE